jgi:hypothetical protein
LLEEVDGAEEPEEVRRRRDQTSLLRISIKVVESRVINRKTGNKADGANDREVRLG